MPVGVQLRELLADLRADTGNSTNAALNIQQREKFVRVLKRTQEELYIAHDWPILEIDRDVQVEAGQRYFAFPTDLNFDFVNAVYVRYGTEWDRLVYGISQEDLSIYNSDDGFQSWPSLKWQYDTDSGQVELWPVPSQAGTIRLRGRKALAPFVDDEDVCTLDSTVLTLFAAAEILAEQKSEKAGYMLQKAQALLTRVLARQRSNKTTPFVIGGGGGDTSGRLRPLRIGLDYIPRGYGSGS